MPERFPPLIPAVLAVVVAHTAPARIHSYTVEAVNDPFITRYPNPAPKHVVTRSFRVHRSPRELVIPVGSTHLHNISVKIENTGDRLIEDPYLAGPWGYDFRSLEAIAARATRGAKTPSEKLCRILQWFTYHYDRFGTRGARGYNFEDFSGNPLRLINQYGGSMCGESVEAMCELLYAAPPVGSIYAHKVQLHGHQTGEAWINGGWRAFDSNPETRWVYDRGDHRPPITFKWLKEHGEERVKRVRPLTGWSIWWAIKKAPCTPFADIRRFNKRWDFRYDLRPAESVTMYFDMRGRVEMKSRNYAEAGFNKQSPEHRNPCDYGSAVFDYRPEFSNPVHRQFAAAQENVRWTDRGLVPADPARPAWIVFPARSTWLIVGARIEADFRTDGKVYIARNRNVLNLRYPPDIPWTRLEPGREEYGPESIEGVMIYWVKFEFQGPGSGLRRARIATEVQMSPYTMPGLRYGENHLRFTARDLHGCGVRITFTYDDQAPYNTYEPATEDYGAYIHYRVGGDHMKTWSKNLFYKNIARDPNGSPPITVEIFKAFGADFGRKVRTLKNGRIPFGDYWWYWNGRDGDGNRLPPGMYAFKVTGDVGEGPWGRGREWGECLMLFDRIRPQPNEIRWTRRP